MYFLYNERFQDPRELQELISQKARALEIESCPQSHLKSCPSLPSGRLLEESFDVTLAGVQIPKGWKPRIGIFLRLLFILDRSNAFIACLEFIYILDGDVLSLFKAK